jgi:hypothetical protein
MMLTVERARRRDGSGISEQSKEECDVNLISKETICLNDWDDRDGVTNRMDGRHLLHNTPSRPLFLGDRRTYVREFCPFLRLHEKYDELEQCAPVGSQIGAKDSPKSIITKAAQIYGAMQACLEQTEMLHLALLPHALLANGRPISAH